MFKYLYGDKMFPNTNKTTIFLAASASAEFLADIALCPFEAIKVRMQTTLPPFANTLREGMSKVVKQEGVAGYVFLSIRDFEKALIIAVCTRASTLSGVVKSHTPCVNSQPSKPQSTPSTTISASPKPPTTHSNKLEYHSLVVTSQVLPAQ